MFKLNIQSSETEISYWIRYIRQTMCDEECSAPRSNSCGLTDPPCGRDAAHKLLPLNVCEIDK